MTGSAWSVVVGFLRDVGRLLIRLPRALGRGLAGFWGSLSIIARRRLVAALGVAVVVVLIFAVAIPSLPCSFPGGDSCPPADDAAELVPADALAYVHANLDPETDQYEAAAKLAARAPLFSDQVTALATDLIAGPAGSAVDFDADLRPWIGGEAALAVLAGPGGGADRVDLLEVDDSGGAAAFASSLAGSRGRTEDYEGVELTTGARGISSAEVDGFLVIGSGEGVRAVIDTATGAEGSEPLAEDDAATEIRDQLPEHRLAEAWLSAEGVSELIAPSTGTLSTLTPLLAPGATEGAAASLSASGDALELNVRSELDPEREQASPSFFAAFPAFEPELDSQLRPGTLAYLGFGDPGRTVSALLAQATAQAPGIAESFADLVDSLRGEGGVDIESQLGGALGNEAAIAVEPPPPADAAGEDAAAVVSAPLPYLLFVAAGVDEDRTREALASLQGPLADAVNPGSGLQAPVFGQQEINGVEAHSLRISPVIELTYAVFDGLAAVATDVEGIAGLAEDEGGLDETGLYESATEGFPARPSLLAFLDLGALVATGERTGLAEDPAYATFAGDFRSLAALGLSVGDADGVLATDARLLLREGERGEEPGASVPAD